MTSSHARGAFLKADTIDVLSLIQERRRRHLKQMIVLSAPDLRAAKEAVRATIEQISTDVANGTRPGFGLVLLQTKSANLCFVANDKVEAHSKLLLDDESKISFDMQVNPTISKTTTARPLSVSKSAYAGRSTPRQRISRPSPRPLDATVFPTPSRAYGSRRSRSTRLTPPRPSAIAPLRNKRPSAHRRPPTNRACGRSVPRI